MDLRTLLAIAASTAPPAGGAPLGEVVAVSLGVAVVTAALLALGVAHRTRRTEVLGVVARAVGRATDRPSWVALPLLLTTSALVTALFGMLWDISLHIAEGRDEGPLANPAHWFILVGLFLLFAAGMTALLLPRDEDPGPAALRITRRWRAPVGGALIAGAGFYALLGFPLDDLWHRLFGQDVTLWGPTHLMLITGAGLSLIGVLVLEREGHRSRPGHRDAHPRLAWILRTSSVGGMLIGLSVFQAEYDFGVPQFRLVLHPVLIAAAAAFALVTARVLLGRGAALAAATFFVVIRGTISILVGPALGEPTPSLPLYLGEALLVEALAFTPLLRRPLPFGAVAGLCIGTVGLALEALWSQVAFLLPWTPDIWVEALATAAPVAVAAGTCGALLAVGLQARLPSPAIARGVVVATVAVLAGAVANGLLITVPDGPTATMALTEVAGGDGREAHAVVTLDPLDLANEPAWLQITSWQGGGLVVDRLEASGDGTYRSTQPVPIDGDWKTLVRLQDGRVLTATPVFMPEDPAIPAAEVPAEALSTRGFGPEIELLQRERDLAAPAWLWLAACLVVLVCSLALVAALSWGVGRLGRRTAERGVAEGELDVEARGDAAVPAGERTGPPRAPANAAPR